jgi:hypothetical protein
LHLAFDHFHGLGAQQQPFAQLTFGAQKDILAIKKREEFEWVFFRIFIKYITIKLITKFNLHLHFKKGNKK